MPSTRPRVTLCPCVTCAQASPAYVASEPSVCPTCTLQPQSAAIVTALGYLDELKKAENGADNMRSQVHEYLEDASKARMEALDASRRLAALQKEVDSLKERIGEV